MYKLIPSSYQTNCVERFVDNACIPFDPANADFAQFKQDLSEGVTLLDAEGNTMSAEQVDAFLQTLP